VNAKLLRYVLHPKEALDAVETLLEQHEQLDRVALLELTVWKAACLALPLKCSIRDGMDMMDWLSVGWEEWKDETRMSAMFTVIMPRVVRFLDVK
jgi:hypothetical protein